MDFQSTVFFGTIIRINRVECGFMDNFHKILPSILFSKKFFFPLLKKENLKKNMFNFI